MDLSEIDVRLGMPGEPLVHIDNGHVTFEWGTFPEFEEGWALVVTPVIKSGDIVGAGVIRRPGPEPGHEVTFHYEDGTRSSQYFADDAPWEERHDADAKR